MKTKTFTFKKTKRVKTVTEYPAISVDLTVKEAADLVAYLTPATTPDGRYQNLLDALRNFAREHGAVSDLVIDKHSTALFGGFVMKRAPLLAQEKVAQAPASRPRKPGDLVYRPNGELGYTRERPYKIMSNPEYFTNGKWLNAATGELY